MLLAVAVTALSFTAGSAAWVLVPFGALVMWLGWRQRTGGRAAVRTHAALQALTRGQTEEAEAHLDVIPKRTGNRTVTRAVAYLRGLVAFHRGDLKSVPAMLEDAVAEKTGIMLVNHEKMQRSLGLSLRALVWASTGDAARARADATEVLASPHALPEAIARARLAEAVVFARDAGSSDALAAHLRTHASLILENSPPRERVLCRALRRMVQSRARSIYREPAPMAEEAEKNALRDWVAQVVPDAAAHAGDGAGTAERAEEAPAPTVTAEALGQIARARVAAKSTTKSPRIWGRVLALWVLLIVMFLTVWQFLTPAERPHHAHAAAPPPEDITPFMTTLIPLLFLGVMIALVARILRRNRRIERDVLAARRADALGNMEEAEALMASLEKNPQGLGLAQAAALRAKTAEQHARFDECVAHCDRALGSIAAQPRATRQVSAFALTPSIIVQRAVALAALGREPEANAELATLAREHPTYGYRAGGELRVRLIAALRRGDLDSARSIARERTAELPISLRDEVLADLVLAVAPSGASREEQERVDAELRDDEMTRTWIDAVAPGLREDLARRVNAGGARINLAEEIQDEPDEERAFSRA